MSAVQREARLHEATVKAVARGELEKRRRGRGPDLRPRQGVTVRMLHPAIRQQVAGVDPGRLEILSPTEVVIWNGPTRPGRGARSRSPRPTA